MATVIPLHPPRPKNRSSDAPGEVLSLRPRLFEKACDEANAQRMADELREIRASRADLPRRLRLVRP